MNVTLLKKKLLQTVFKFKSRSSLAYIRAYLINVLYSTKQSDRLSISLSLCKYFSCRRLRGL